MGSGASSAQTQSPPSMGRGTAPTSSNRTDATGSPAHGLDHRVPVSAVDGRRVIPGSRVGIGPGGAEALSTLTRVQRSPPGSAETPKYVTPPNTGQGEHCKGQRGEPHPKR